MLRCRVSLIDLLPQSVKPIDLRLKFSLSSVARVANTNDITDVRYGVRSIRCIISDTNKAARAQDFDEELQEVDANCTFARVVRSVCKGSSFLVRMKREDVPQEDIRGYQR